MIRSAAISDQGLKRKTNQDSYRSDDQCQLYLVADGMGGHKAGEVASALAVDTVEDFVRVATAGQEFTWPFGYDSRSPFEHNVLTTAVRMANSKVFQAAEQQEKYAGMGSTLVLVWVRDRKAFYTHIGDSRIYLLKKNRLQQLTEDHSLVQEQLTLGIITKDQVKDHSLRHVVTRAIGINQLTEIEMGELDLAPEDTLILCTDGLTDRLEDNTLQEILQKDSDLQTACKILVDAANGAGGDDNVTVLLLRFEE